MTKDQYPGTDSSDLMFITNEAGQSLRDRFAVLLGKDTRFFDCLVGYFFISGFYRIYPALENVEKIRILVGLQTDRKAYDDEEYIRNVIQLLADGALPRPTTKKVAEALKKPENIEPLKVLGILRCDISSLLFQPTRAQQMHHERMPREVILSSWVLPEGSLNEASKEKQ
jgi:hypothetical protein